MAGAAVTLSPGVQRRIGITGFGVDDTGVIEHPTAVSGLLKVGQYLGGVSDREIDALIKVAHGSKQQVRLATRLANMALRCLRSEIEERVDGALKDVPGAAGKTYDEYREWASGSGWEFPVGCFDTDVGRCFCLTDDAGLSVFECSVASVPGRIGDVLLTITHLLVDEAMKTPATVAIEYATMLGLDVSSLARIEGFDAMRNASGAEVADWLKHNDNDIYTEIVYWDGHEESVHALACQARDIAFAHLDEANRIKNVVGELSSSVRTGFADYLNAITKAAKSCPAGELKRFALLACELLKGKTRSELIDALGQDARFERMPGTMCILNTGVPIEGVYDQYQHLNDVAMNADEYAIIPLETDPAIVVDLLVRITLCERLLLAMGVTVEASLSEQEAA